MPTWHVSLATQTPSLSENFMNVQCTVILIIMFHSLWHLNILSPCIVSNYLMYIITLFLFLYFSCNGYTFSQSYLLFLNCLLKQN